MFVVGADNFSFYLFVLQPHAEYFQRQETPFVRTSPAGPRTVRNGAPSERKFASCAETVAAGDKDGAAAQLKVCVKALDRAGSHGLMHKNAAARTKSRLSKLVKSLA